MANESKLGINQKVTIVVGGASNILGMGTWEMSGSAYDLLDDTEYGDTYAQNLAGLFTGGTVTFSGRYKKDDTTGQTLVRAAFYYQSNVTDIRFYVDSVSYYTPNSTTAAGGGLPASVPVSHIKFNEEPTTTSDKADLMNVSFTGTVVGAMRLI
jgi:hypothetical protein